MHLSIVTRHGQTNRSNVSAPCIVAKSGRRWVEIPYESDKTEAENHFTAVIDLLYEMKFLDESLHGEPTKTGYQFTAVGQPANAIAA